MPNFKKCLPCLLPSASLTYSSSPRRSRIFKLFSSAASSTIRTAVPGTQDHGHPIVSALPISSSSASPTSLKHSLPDSCHNPPTSSFLSAPSNLNPFPTMSLQWQGAQPLSWSRIPAVYMDLSKARLAALVTLTTMCGYSMEPLAHDLFTLSSLTVGTALCIASANTFNQWIEVPYDACMSRTWNRPLVRRRITPFHAFNFGIISGLAGVASLYAFVNPTTAFLGGLNIVLYTCVYTPLKRQHIVNTWVGAIVGAIPPMMGWAACTGSIADPRAFLLGAVLYCWQFPHFNALSCYIRHEYKRGGYKMMADTHPALNKRVALRYSLALIPLSVGFSSLGMTTWWFALDGSLLSAALSYYSYRFYRTGKDQSARKLFFMSLIHLPVFFALMLFHKNTFIEGEPSDGS